MLYKASIIILTNSSSDSVMKKIIHSFFYKLLKPIKSQHGVTMEKNYQWKKLIHSFSYKLLKAISLHRVTMKKKQNKNKCKVHFQLVITNKQGINYKDIINHKYKNNTQQFHNINRPLDTPGSFCETAALLIDNQISSRDSILKTWEMENLCSLRCFRS